MARAFIVLRRSDLPDNFLQVLDLVPNVSQQSWVYEPPGQTTYISEFLIDGINVQPQVTGVGPILIDGDSYGLSSYVIDRIEGPGVLGALPALTPVQAAAAAAEIEDQASNGGELTLAALNTALSEGLVVSDTAQGAGTGADTLQLSIVNTEADDFYNGWTVAITGGTGAGQTDTIIDYTSLTDEIQVSAVWILAPDATSVYDMLPPVDLDGTATNSIGTVEDVLRILSGERYKMPDGTEIEDAGNLFVATAGGFFTTGIGRLQPTITGPGGKKSTAGPVLPHVLATQGPTEDLNHNYIREILNTGDLHRSALLGVLAELKDPGYTFINSSLIYGVGGTALMLDGTTVVGLNGQAPAVQVYADDGTII